MGPIFQLARAKLDQLQQVEAVLRAAVCTQLSFSHDDAGSNYVMSARDEVLGWGLIDWVELDRIHRCVAAESVGQPIPVVQAKTLELIRLLVNDGLFVVGDVKRNIGFTAWDTPLDQLIERIRDVYVTNFHDENTWMWFCWLAITEKGLVTAESLSRT